MLIERGAQLDALIPGTQRSPLHIAVYNQFTDCVAVLIWRGCNINLKVHTYFKSGLIQNKLLKYGYI